MSDLLTSLPHNPPNTVLSSPSPPPSLAATTTAFAPRIAWTMEGSSRRGRVYVDRYLGMWCGDGAGFGKGLVVVVWSLVTVVVVMMVVMVVVVRCSFGSALPHGVYAPPGMCQCPDSVATDSALPFIWSRPELNNTAHAHTHSTGTHARQCTF